MTAYLDDMGPNALRQQAMDRVGELPPEHHDHSARGNWAPTYSRGTTDILPEEAKARAEFPMFDGLLAYFPAALIWVSHCSFKGGQQHHPEAPLHWDMDKSTDHENKILRHMMAGFTDDGDGVPHSVKVAWRALARAQEDLMRRFGAPMPPNARRAHAECGNPVNQRDED